jgi:hypothetical protein
LQIEEDPLLEDKMVVFNGSKWELNHADNKGECRRNNRCIMNIIYEKKRTERTKLQVSEEHLEPILKCHMGISLSIKWKNG